MAIKPPSPPAPGPRRSGPGGKPQPPVSPFAQFRSVRFWITLGIVLALNLLISNFLSQPPQPKTVTLAYSNFVQQVTDDNVTSITAVGNTITGQAKSAVKDVNGKDTAKAFTTETRFYALGPASPREALLDHHHVTRLAKPITDTTPLWQTLLFSFGPTILFLGLFLYISRRMAGASAGGILGSFGQSRAKLYDAESPPTTFADVAGIDEVKAELLEIVDFLREPQKYERLGGRVPKGVLLVGPPGTGKTLLARAVAGEAKVPFFSQGASEFVEAIVGVGASRVRDLFAKARAAAPAIIFIDELDAIGRSPG